MIIQDIKNPNFKKQKIRQIEYFITYLHTNKLILGDLEVPLNVVVEILDLFFY